MKALRFSQYGQPEVLRIVDMEVPTPGPDEVLVRVSAAAINPSDVKNVAGLFSAVLPRIPGRDFAGTVVSEGAWHGCEVWGSGVGFGVTRDGGQAEYLCLPVQWLSTKPANLSMAEAATVGVPYITAWTALVRVGDIRPGETILITGSSGAVGHAAIQIAHWKGAQVIGVGISDRKSEADLYINGRNQDMLAAIANATAGGGVDLALDTVGGAMFENSLKALRKGGRQIAISSTGKSRVEFDLTDFYHRQLHLIGMDTMKLTGGEIAAILDEFRHGFESGTLRPSAFNLFSVEKAVEAYTNIAAGRSTRKQIIYFD